MARQPDNAEFDGSRPEWTTLVYSELRRLAEKAFRDQPKAHTLQPTALVHEAYVKLAARGDEPWTDRDHFLATAATAMRHILVDHARARAAAKRGGARQRVTLDEGLQASKERDVDLLVLNEALESLAEIEERKAKVIELRFFAGLSLEETAKALGVSAVTVSNDWRFGRAWIGRALEAGTSS